MGRRTDGPLRGPLACEHHAPHGALRRCSRPMRAALVHSVGQPAPAEAASQRHRRAGRAASRRPGGESLRETAAASPGLRPGLHAFARLASSTPDGNGLARPVARTFRLRGTLPRQLPTPHWNRGACRTESQSRGAGETDSRECTGRLGASLTRLKTHSRTTRPSRTVSSNTRLRVAGPPSARRAVRQCQGIASPPRTKSRGSCRSPS